jgi:predicted phosphodiesterase
MKISKYEDFIPQNIATKNATKIGIYQGDKKVGSFGLNNLSQYFGTLQYSFGAISDIHIQRTTAKDDLQKSLTLFNNIVDFVCVCGDLTESGTAEQLQEYKDFISTYSSKPVYAVSGNHESYSSLDMSTVIQTYTNQPLYYSFTKGNDVFIMVGIIGEYDLFTSTELQWLYETLETNRNKRCFVFQHVFNGKEKEAVCGNPYGLYHNYCWNNPTQTTVFESLMKHYKNVIWFHGHSHFRFNLQTKNCIYANVDKSEGYWSVHIPSLSIPREDANGDGVTEYYTAGSEGYVIEVYENGVYLRGRDFIKDEYLSIASYWLDTTLVDIPAKTFIDSTGTITA